GVAILERLVEIARAGKYVSLRARSVEAGELASAPLLAGDPPRAGRDPALAIRLGVVAEIAVVGGGRTDQGCEEHWQRKRSGAAHVDPIPRTVRVLGRRGF